VDGLLDGYSEEFHRQGGFAKGNYKMGTKVGSWKSYYKTGELRTAYEYPNQPQEVNQFHPQPVSQIHYEKDGSVKKKR